MTDLNLSNPADPCNYEPRTRDDGTPFDGQTACRDCGCWAWDGDGIRHSSLCDIAPRATVTPGTKVREASSSRAQIRRLAKEGSVRSVLSDDELVDAVRCGLVSESDAMNQDF